jgi:hypothetical protein
MDESWQLAGPDKAALAEMAAHLNRDHGAAFDPRIHLSHAAHRRSDARIFYLPVGPEMPDGAQKLASFECLLCDPPQRFLLNPTLDFNDAGTRQRWLRENPALADEVAACEVPEELIAAAIDAYVHGEVVAGGLAEWLRGQRRQKLAKRRPKDAAREDGCMRFLLERRLEGLTVEKAIETLLKLQAEDPEEWRKLTGGTRTVTEPTLERYWSNIPRPVRKAAEAAISQDGGASPELRERLLAKLSPSNDLPQTPRTEQARGHGSKPLLPPPGALKERGGVRARRQR